MKKFLLTLIVVLLSGTVYAQKQYDIEKAINIVKSSNDPCIVSEWKGSKVYFDPQWRQYLTAEKFENRYGEETRIMLDSLYEKGELCQPNIQKNNDKTASPFLAKNFGSRNTDRSKFDNRGRSFKWKLTPLNTVVGSSMIGASAATYMLTSSIIDNKMANESDVEKISSLAKTKRTVGIVCAGTSVIGIVVVLTGLHKEYAQGIELGHNLTVSDYGAGISLTKKF